MRLHFLFPLLLLLPGTAAAQAFLADRIAAADPCAGLEVRQTVFGSTVSVGLTQVTSVAIRSVSLSMEEEVASLDLDGSIACRTSGDSILQGEASMDLTAEAEVALGDCSVTRLTLAPTGFGGGLGDLVEAAWPDLLRPALEDEARRMLTRACTDLKAAP